MHPRLPLPLLLVAHGAGGPEVGHSRRQKGHELLVAKLQTIDLFEFSIFSCFCLADFDKKLTNKKGEMVPIGF